MATLTKKLFSQRSFLGNIIRYVSSIPSDVVEQVPKVGTTLAEQALTEQVPKVGATLAEHLPKAVAEQALVTDQGLATKVLNEAYKQALAEEVSKLLDMEESKVVPIVQKMSEFPSTPKVLDKVKYVDPKQTNLADYMPNLPDLPQDPYKFIVDI
ncbi:hypothetical protein Tco_1095473, partial [Tanacetum coccineum]